MSTSRIRDSEAEMFSTDTFRLAIVCSNRFCTAPRLARLVDTDEIAESIEAMALEAFPTRSMLLVPRIPDDTPLIVTARLSPLLAPIWNVELAELTWADDVLVATPGAGVPPAVTANVFPAPTWALDSSTFHR